MLKKRNPEEVVLWESVEKDFNGTNARNWTSLSFRELLREMHGSNLFSEVLCKTNHAIPSL